VTGGAVAGTYINAPAATSVTIPRPDWNAQIEQRGRERAIAAFLDELREICATRLVVLILDSFDDKCNATVREWAKRYLVGGLCLAPAGRAARLALVAAGRQTPDFVVPAYQGRIKTIDSLGLWEENHLRDFLALHQITLAPEMLEFVHTRLKEGL